MSRKIRIGIPTDMVKYSKTDAPIMPTAPIAKGMPFADKRWPGATGLPGSIGFCFSESEPRFL